MINQRFLELAIPALLSLIRAGRKSVDRREERAG
jgi:hypothetical protein